MQRFDWVVHALATCILLSSSEACTQGPGPDDSSRWYAPPGASPPPSGSADQVDTDGEEDEGETDTDEGGSGESGDGSAGSSGADDDGASGDGTTGAAETTGADSSGNDVLDACLDIAANACEECGCNSCLDPLQACELDAGCKVMRECAQASGCTDAVSCYEACQDVIDANGGPFGSSAELASSLSDCMEGSCQVCF